jgi:hypothetical protein
VGEGAQLPFELAVACRDVGMRAKVVPQLNVAAMGRVAPDHGVQMVFGKPCRLAKRLAARHTQIALVLVAGQPLDHPWDVLRPRDDDVEVDDRLRGKTGDGGAPDVLDLGGNIAQRR